MDKSKQIELLKKKLEEMENENVNHDTYAVIKGNGFLRWFYGILYNWIAKPLHDSYKRKYDANKSRTFSFVEFEFVDRYFVKIQVIEIDTKQEYLIAMTSPDYALYYDEFKENNRVGKTDTMPSFVNFNELIKQQLNKMIKI